MRGDGQHDDSGEPPGKSIPKRHREKIINAALSNTRACGDLKCTAGERNALMIKIGWICGLRAYDIVKLKAGEFISEKGTVRTKVGKNLRWHKMDINHRELTERISEYIEKNNMREHDWLFPSEEGGHMSVAAFAGMFNRVLKTAGLPRGKLNGGYTLHDLRRTCATVLYNNGRLGGLSLKEVSKRLGHSSVTTTEKYLRLAEGTDDGERARKVVESCFD